MKRCRTGIRPCQSVAVLFLILASLWLFDIGAEHKINLPMPSSTMMICCRWIEDYSESVKIYDLDLQNHTTWEHTDKGMINKIKRENRCIPDHVIMILPASALQFLGPENGKQLVPLSNTTSGNSTIIKPQLNPSTSTLPATVACNIKQQ